MFSARSARNCSASGSEAAESEQRASGLRGRDGRVCSWHRRPSVMVRLVTGRTTVGPYDGAAWQRLRGSRGPLPSLVREPPRDDRPTDPVRPASRDRSSSGRPRTSSRPQARAPREHGRRVARRGPASAGPDARPATEPEPGRRARAGRAARAARAAGARAARAAGVRAARAADVRGRCRAARSAAPLAPPASLRRCPRRSPDALPPLAPLPPPSPLTFDDASRCLPSTWRRPTRPAGYELPPTSGQERAGPTSRAAPPAAAIGPACATRASRLRTPGRGAPYPDEATPATGAASVPRPGPVRAPSAVSGHAAIRRSRRRSRGRHPS